MTRDKEHNPTHYDPIAAYAQGGIRLSEEAPFALTKGVRQEITWQFEDPGPQEKLIYFVYMEDPGVFYECQCLFNRPVPYIPSTSTPSDGPPTLAPFPSSSPSPTSTSGRIHCYVCSTLNRGYVDCGLCHGKKGNYVTERGYGVEITYWKDCTRCGGSGKVKCHACGGDGWLND